MTTPCSYTRAFSPKSFYVVGARPTQAASRSDIEQTRRRRRLYKLFENGVTEQDNIIKVRLVGRDRAHVALAGARAGSRAAVAIGPVLIERFGQSMPDILISAEAPCRMASIGAIVDRVVVGDYQIRIVGWKDVVEQAAMAHGGPVLAGMGPGFRSFVRNWRNRREDDESDR